MNIMDIYSDIKEPKKSKHDTVMTNEMALYIAFVTLRFTPSQVMLLVVRHFMGEKKGHS